MFLSISTRNYKTNSMQLNNKWMSPSWNLNKTSKHLTTTYIKNKNNMKKSLSTMPPLKIRYPSWRQSKTTSSPRMKPTSPTTSASYFFSKNQTNKTLISGRNTLNSKNIQQLKEKSWNWRIWDSGNKTMSSTKITLKGKPTSAVNSLNSKKPMHRKIVLKSTLINLKVNSLPSEQN